MYSSSQQSFCTSLSPAQGHCQGEERGQYRASDRTKQLRKKARAVRKGLLDQQSRMEGVVYAADAFGSGDSPPGPSSTGSGEGEGRWCEEEGKYLADLGGRRERRLRQQLRQLECQGLVVIQHELPLFCASCSCRVLMCLCHWISIVCVDCC